MDETFLPTFSGAIKIQSVFWMVQCAPIIHKLIIFGLDQLTYDGYTSCTNTDFL
jgi:hypothetical protein